MNLHPVATQVRKRKVIFVQLYRQHTLHCNASSGRLLQQIQSRQFLKKCLSSGTSGIFQSHCLCSLCKIIDSTYKTEVSGRTLPTHFMHIPISLSLIAKYTENDCSLLRSKIRALHPVHRASLEALLRHLLRVASHSDKNQMTVEPLAAAFSGAVLRGQVVLQDSLDVKARCNYF